MSPKRRARGRPRVDAISDSQRRALKVLRDFIARRRFPPTVKELGALLDVTPASAHQLVKQLERKGYVTRQPGKARGLAILRDPGLHIETLVEVPLIGTVRAGPLMLAEENLEGRVLVESGLTGRGPCFALRVSGDSMSGAGLRQGDIIVVRRQPVAESGEIVVVLVDNEATVKRLVIQGDVIELRPENKRYKPIIVSAETEVQILGKVIGIRSMARS